MPILLGVNIDHIATIRQARRASEPSVLEAAVICCECGVNAITMHLREDRRHIQDSDIYQVSERFPEKINLEMSLADEIVDIAKKVKPVMATLVPEKREEITTEGGLNVRAYFDKIKKTACIFKDLNILVSLFIEPDNDIINLSKDAGADFIEFHTGAYAEAFGGVAEEKELSRLLSASEHAAHIGLGINAGHGLNYSNIRPVLNMKNLHEVNIGHSIISRAVFTGLQNAVTEMQNILNGV